MLHGNSAQTLSHKQVTILPLEWLPVDVKYFTAQVQRHARETDKAPTQIHTVTQLYTHAYAYTHRCY